MSVLIVEGLTGTGKSSTIQALRSVSGALVIDEEATFDDFATEFFADRNSADRRARDRLMRILDKIETEPPSRRIVLERFHFSQLAMGSEWHWYREINDRALELGARVAILTLPESALANRSLYRDEYGGADWQNLVGAHGSEAAALEVLRTAQRLRLEAVARSGLEYRSINTEGAQWKRYAAEIAEWMGWR